MFRPELMTEEPWLPALRAVYSEDCCSAVQWLRGRTMVLLPSTSSLRRLRFIVIGRGDGRFGMTIGASGFARA